jgi:hypothetical protein
MRLKLEDSLTGVLYNIPVENGSIEPNVQSRKVVPGNGIQGKNDKGDLGYTGPCPPKGTHRYYIHLYALDQVLDLPPGATHQELNAAMEGHVLAQAGIMGKYAKQAEKSGLNCMQSSKTSPPSPVPDPDPEPPRDPEPQPGSDPDVVPPWPQSQFLT